jgi:integrase/recombinase XerD
MTEREDEIVEIFLSRLTDTKSDGTAKHRKSHINQFRGWLEAHDRPCLLKLSRYDVEDHFEAIRDNHPDTTALARLDAINAFYNWLREDRDRLEGKHGITVKREDNPARGILEPYEDIDFSSKKSKIYDYDIVALTRDEAEKLVNRENIPDPKTRNQLLLKIFLQTGVRVSEIREIKLGDITQENNRIRVRDQKTNERRTVFYQPELNSLLDKWRMLRKTHATSEESEYLFLTYKKAQMSRSAIGEIVRETAHNAGIQDEMYEDEAGNSRWKVTPHTLRHTYARFAVTGDNRMDVSRLARLMGHTDKHGNPNVETTQKYLAFTEDDLREASTACIPSI